MKHVFKLTPVSLYDIQGLERWLEEQAREGLFPVWVNGDFTQFRRDSGARGARFRLEAANGQEYPEPEQLELYRQAGWEYGSTVSKFYFLFYATDPGAPELHTDPVTRGLSLDWLAQHVKRALKKMRIWRLVVLGLFLLSIALVWTEFPRRLPLLLVNLSGSGLIYLLWFLWMWRREEREARLLLELQHSLELGISPPPAPRAKSRLFWPMTALTLLILAGGWLYERPVPLEDFSRPYLDLRQLESEPLVDFATLFHEPADRDWNQNAVSRHFSFLSPSYYDVTQNLFSREEGSMANAFSPDDSDGYRYSPDLTGVYFRLAVPALARPVARAQMDQLELANFTWHYEELQVPGLDFVLLARAEHGACFQLAAAGRGGRLAVFRYAGRENLSQHLDLLAAAVA